MTTPEQQLQALRDRIDSTDDALAQLFIQRIGIIREVAQLKAANWPNSCHIRPGREGQMHRSIAERYKDSPFPPLMALAMWRQLIGGSTHLESPLNISYLGGYPEHYFLGREYFGLQIGTTKAKSLSEAIAHYEAGESNILILPHPSKHEWWRDAAVLEKHNLKIFGALPVVQHNLAEEFTPAVALAPITPEDSGDDISYFLNQSGALEVIDVFKTSHENSIYLGSHPRPIQLDLGAVHV